MQQKHEPSPISLRFCITSTSKVKVFRIPTDEELAIARDTEEIVKNLKK